MEYKDFLLTFVEKCMWVFIAREVKNTKNFNRVTIYRIEISYFENCWMYEFLSKNQALTDDRVYWFWKNNESIGRLLGGRS